MLSFYEDIYSIVAGQEAWDRKGFGMPRLVAEQPRLEELWREGRGLAIGTHVEVDIYKKVHRHLREEAAAWPTTTALWEKHADCVQKNKTLLSKLNILEKRGDFKGLCQICRPWYSGQ
jgi:hypothetical protein